MHRPNERDIAIAADCYRVRVMPRQDGRDGKEFALEIGSGWCDGIYERREVQVLTEQGDVVKSRRIRRRPVLRGATRGNDRGCPPGKPPGSATRRTEAHPLPVPDKLVQGSICVMGVLESFEADDDVEARTHERKILEIALNELGLGRTAARFLDRLGGDVEANHHRGALVDEQFRPPPAATSGVKHSFAADER